MENKGQLSLEYMLFFLISLIILSVITLPLMADSLEDVNDMTSGVEAKDLLVEISNAVKIINSMDDSSKKTISVKAPQNLTIYSSTSSNKYYLYTYITLSDNSSKRVQVSVPKRVCFNNRTNYYYVRLREGYYYNVEVSCIKSSTNESFINVNFN